MKQKHMNRGICCLLLVLLALQTPVGGQSVVANITSKDGLPSDHVYNVVKDHNGYLWIETPNGLVKYNGYGYRLFNAAVGLPTDDIWGLQEDSSGCLWIMSISNELGYIRNDIYHPIIRTRNNEAIYPKSTRAYGSGIVFLSPRYYKGNKTGMDIYLASKDTFYKYDLGRYGSIHALITPQAELLTVVNGCYYRMRWQDRGWVKKRLIEYDTAILQKTEGRAFVLFHEHLLGYGYKNRYIWALNLVNNKKPEALADFDNSEIVYIYAGDEHVYVNSEFNIFKKDSSLATVKVFSIRALTDSGMADRTKPSILVEDGFWGNMFCTQSNGLYMHYNLQNRFNKRVGNNLDGFRFAGCINDSICYRWNNTTRVLAEFRNNVVISFTPLAELHNVKNVHPFDDTTSVIVDERNIYWFDHRKKKLGSCFEDTAGNNAGFRPSLASPIEVVVLNRNILYGIFNGPKGFYHHISRSEAAASCTIDHFTYRHIAHDSYRDGIWVTGKQKILFYSLSKKKSFSIYLDHLKKIGIRKIESVIADNTHGNILLKDEDVLWCFNLSSGRIRKLSDGYNFTKSVISIYQNKIIIAGRFGIVFSDVSGSGRFGRPVVYHNIKNYNYRDVNDVQVSGDEVLLSTDNGYYTVPIPAATPSPKVAPHYKLLAYYNDSLVQVVNTGDSIVLNAGVQELTFDIINPRGNGALRFKNSAGAEGHNMKDMKSGLLHLAAYNTGEYIPVSVVAYDDVWNSKPVQFFVYKTPLWWQRTSTIIIFAIAALLIISALGALVYIITRRNVLKKASRRNHIMALELKAIYSQINPHFIFNTLSTALFFIKSGRTGEAYMHIIKFSKLLRVYLRSSRNRFTTLDEEILNLRNYIELQQSRFVNRFEFTIHVHEGIDAAAVQIPTLLLQPLVENAINHGLLNKETKGNLRIGFYKDIAGAITCVIDDDGIGREQARNLKTESTLKTDSYGTMLIEDLIQVYNHYEDVSISIDYVDKQPSGTGTMVRITIKSRS